MRSYLLCVIAICGILISRWVCSSGVSGTKRSPQGCCKAMGIQCCCWKSKRARPLLLQGHGDRPRYPDNEKPVRLKPPITVCVTRVGVSVPGISSGILDSLKYSRVECSVTFSGILLLVEVTLSCVLFCVLLCGTYHCW